MPFAGFNNFFKDAARGLPPKSGAKKPAAKKPAAKKPAAKKQPEMPYPFKMPGGNPFGTVKIPPKPKPSPPKGRGKVVRGTGRAAAKLAGAKTNAKAPVEKGKKECTCKH